MCGRLDRINYASAIKYVSHMLVGKGRNHAQHNKNNDFNKRGLEN